MEPLAVAQRYFDAWNARDPEAIAATFAPGGTYSDPNVPEGLDPQGTGEYARGLFASFPDLRFELETTGLTSEGLVAAQWLMRGTNTEPFQGLPPTGLEVSVPGADFIQVDGDRVRSVRGYFDGGTMVRQLGLDVIVQPSAIGPFFFGTSTYVSKRNDLEPGAMSLTVLETRSEEEKHASASFHAPWPWTCWSCPASSAGSASSRVRGCSRLRPGRIPRASSSYEGAMPTATR